MRSKVFFALVLAAGLAAGLPSAHSAADKTLGMALMTASVNSSGLLTRSYGAVSSETAGPKGQYKVVFVRAVYPACTFAATITGPGETGEQGMIVADGSSGDHVLVRTYDKNGDFANRPFNLIAFCWE